MKIFTDKNKWQDPWFRKLSGPAKMLWFYITDHADKVGIADLDFGLASQDCGIKITEDHLSELGKRVVWVDEDKVFMPKYIDFQYGKLSPNCPPHKKIIQLVESLELERIGSIYEHPNARVALPLRKGKDRKGMEKIRKDKGTEEELKEYAKELGLPETDGQAMFDHWEANGWKNGQNRVKCWRAGMRKWKNSGWLPSQKSQPDHRATKASKEYQENLEINEL